jgi:hypothetical protein
MAERSSEIPPNVSGTPRIGSPIDEQLLVLRRRQVEDPGRGRGGHPDAGPSARAGPGERPAGRGRGPEAAPRDGEHRLLGLLAQPDAVEQLTLRHPVERGDGEADRVAGLAGRDAVLAAGAEVPRQGHARNVTPSYNFRHGPRRCPGSHVAPTRS